MPIFEFRCEGCGLQFEELVKSCLDLPPCPKCGKPAQRVWSGKVYSSTGKPAKKCSGNCANCSGCK